jgi:hypothetical protein
MSGSQHHERQELHEVLERLKQISNQLQLQMSTLSDLQTAVATLTANTATETSAVLSAIADINSLPASDAQLVPLTAAITAAATQMQTNAAALLAAVGPGTVVTPPGTAPVITTQPLPAFTGSVAAGTTSASLTVATSDPSPTYQWFTGSPGAVTPAPVVIPGATSAAYSTPVQTAPSTISYFAAVTNSAGTTNSATSVVTVVA